MSFQAISASAKDVGKIVLETSKTVAKWCGHQVSTGSRFLISKAAIIANMITEFVKTLPHYFSVGVNHFGTFLQHIRNNKANSAEIAGITVAVTLLALTIISHLSKEPI